MSPSPPPKTSPGAVCRAVPTLEAQWLWGAGGHATLWEGVGRGHEKVPSIFCLDGKATSAVHHASHWSYVILRNFTQ